MDEVEKALNSAFRSGVDEALETADLAGRVGYRIQRHQRFRRFVLASAVLIGVALLAVLLPFDATILALTPAEWVNMLKETSMQVVVVALVLGYWGLFMLLSE